MKKVLLSVAVVAAFASCGGPSICDCVNEAEGVDKEVCDKMEKEWKDKFKDASDDDKKKMREEVDACKKDEKSDEKEH